MSQSLKTGFVGKIPSHGDYVYRNISKEIETSLLNWCQEGMHYSESKLGDGFLSYFLVAPVWRLYCSESFFGTPFIATWIPSVDKVGRYFPFMLVCEVQRKLDPFDLNASKWFELAEELSISVLNDQFGFDSFLTEVQKLKSPASSWEISYARDYFDSEKRNGSRTIEIKEENGQCEFNSVLNQLLLRSYTENFVQLWTGGGEKKKGSMLVDPGFFEKETFLKMLGEF